MWVWWVTLLTPHHPPSEYWIRAAMLAAAEPHNDWLMVVNGSGEKAYLQP